MVSWLWTGIPVGDDGKQVGDIGDQVVIRVGIVVTC